MYLIIYITRKKEIIYRIVKYKPFVNINEYTSMGWYVVDIQKFYNGKFISLVEYKEIIEEDTKKDKEGYKKNINKRLKRKILNNIKFNLKKVNTFIDKHIN